MKHMLNDFLVHTDVSNSGSVHTESAYERDVSQFLNYFEHRDTNTFTQDDAYEYLESLYQLQLSPATVARKVSTLRSFFLFLQQNYAYPTNPFSHIQIKRQNRTLPHFLSHLEMDQLLMSCEANPLGVRNYVLIELMYACGLRVSELVDLKVKDLDLETRSLHVIGKGDKQRVLFFYESLVPKLTAYLKNTRPVLLGSFQHQSLFTNQKGAPITASSVTYLLNQQGLKAGLRQKVHPHILRHSFATHLLDNGASIRIVQTLLGHESLSTTQIYTHVSLNRIKSAYEHAMSKLELT